MPLPFEEFQGKGICDFSSFSSSFSDQPPPSPLLDHRKIRKAPSSEPNSVLDALSPLTTSSSTVSSSNGGNSIVGGGGGISVSGDEQQIGLGDWELPSSSSPTHDHDQSILRLIMGGDSTDPSFELNNILQTSSTTSSPIFHDDSGYTTNLGFGIVDTGFGLDHSVPPLFQTQEKQQPPHVLINQSQTHFTPNQTIFYGQATTIQPPAKRLNTGGPMGFPVITDQISKLAEVIENGEDTCLAQTILARLNQQLSSPTKPFERAAFYFKEALHNLATSSSSSSSSLSSPYSLVFKIAAYKSFSEISPVLQFANFTSNQALLESFNGFHRFHIIDFDIGYGGQWASLMQELVLRDNGGSNSNSPISVKLTVFASPANHDQLELGFTQENLKHFASEINISLQIQVLSLDLIGTISWPPSEKEEEAIAVNLSAATSFSPLILRFVKHLSPTIIVCSDKGCERTDLPFHQQMIHSLQSQTALLESLDAVNATVDVMQKIERFLIQPEIEKFVFDRSRSSSSSSNRPMMTWQAMFMQMGFSPVTHSNFTESQAECLVQRTPVRGFHVEKKHNSLLLCWQRRELVGVSAWKSRSS